MKTDDHLQIRWADISRVAYMCGIVKDFSKGEMLRLSEKMKPENNDRVAKISRGLYGLSPKGIELWRKTFDREQEPE